MLAVVGGGHGHHLGAQVDGVAQEAAFVLLQVEDAGVAGVGGALVDGDGPWVRCMPVLFLKTRPNSGNFGCVRSLKIDTRSPSTSLPTMGSSADF